MHSFLYSWIEYSFKYNVSPLNSSEYLVSDRVVKYYYKGYQQTKGKYLYHEINSRCKTSISIEQCNKAFLNSYFT